MKTMLAFLVVCALLPNATSAQVPHENVTPAKNSGDLAALVKKLLRTWQGPACGGDFTFNPDGTFNVRTWALRWDALPPTLSPTFKSSDFKRTYPGEPDYKYVGKTIEAKLLTLSDTALAFEARGTDWNWRGEPRINNSGKGDERSSQK